VRLGQIGDQVFALAITDLIQDLYPHLRVGPASVRQSAVIRNRYHLTLRLSRKSEIA
jgi:dsRNA-specific ribonuclease